MVEEARHTRLQAQLRRLEEKAGRLLPPEPQAPIDIEDVTPQTLEVSAQQLRKLGLEAPAEPQGDADPQPSASPGSRRIRAAAPSSRTGRNMPSGSWSTPTRPTPRNWLDIQTRLRKDPLYRTWLGLEDETSAPASASIPA